MDTLADSTACSAVFQAVQLYFDSVIVVTKLLYNRLPHTSQDYKETFSDVKQQKHIRYGALRNEVYHLIRPAADAPSRGCIFYVHGGGFVSTSFELYDASVAYLARSGYTVVGVDYPLAPLSRHPQPVMSVLAAVEHFVAHEGSVGDLILMGDSAGANIALMAAAVLVNPPLMQLMQRASRACADTHSSESAGSSGCGGSVWNDGWRDGRVMQQRITGGDGAADI